MRLIRIAAMEDRTGGDRMSSLNRRSVVSCVIRAAMIEAAERVPARGRRQEGLAGRHRVSGVLPLGAMADNVLAAETGGCGRDLPALMLALAATAPACRELRHEATTPHIR